MSRVTRRPRNSTNSGVRRARTACDPLVSFSPGQIVIVDWRDALPKEPNKLRPAIVIEDTDLFGPDYPNVILVPLSQDQKLAIRAFSLGIDPTASNGCPNRCYALSNYVAATSKQR